MNQKLSRQDASPDSPPPKSGRESEFIDAWVQSVEDTPEQRKLARLAWQTLRSFYDDEEPP